MRLDGKVVKACIVLAALVEGREVVTIEGADDLSEVQAAFVAGNELQCGHCTTGMVLTVAELLRSNPDPSDAEIRHAVIGHLCRCTWYDLIVAAIRRASRALRPEPILPGLTWRALPFRGRRGRSRPRACRLWYVT